MIVEFSVGNFRSIKDVQTISFVATGLKSPEGTDVDFNNIAKENGLRLLKTIGIYGPNASGKSNIIRALDYFLQSIKNESSSNSNLEFICDPFLYQENPYSTESFFQVVFILEGKKYRYGFTIKKNQKTRVSITENYSEEIITNEWLFATKEKNVVEYFIRKGIEVDKDKLPNSVNIPPLQYEHSIFLTHAAAYDKDGDCVKIRNFFRKLTISNILFEFKGIRQNTLFMIEDDNKQKTLLSLLSSFNLNYQNLRIDKDVNSSLADITHNQIYLRKQFYDKQNNLSEIELNLDQHESDGTKKLFDLAGLLYTAFNASKAGLIMIDEIDSNFHPSLLKKLIEMFNNPQINKSNAQLLFTSHDTNLMSPNLMRRDQFYLTEKKMNESTKAYSLADLRGIRNTADFAKEYLSGMYGALPVLEDFTFDSNESND